MIIFKINLIIHLNYVIILFILIFYFLFHIIVDHGSILTHDTEQFIIGQRVWVGGIRPGQIAYIGDTHFAPGEWAGVVLDDPNGMW